MMEARRSRHEPLYSSSVVLRYSYEKSITLSQLGGGMASLWAPPVCGP